MVRKSKKSKKNKKRGGMRDISVSPSRKRKNPYAEGQGHSMDIATNIKDLATLMERTKIFFDYYLEGLDVKEGRCISTGSAHPPIYSSRPARPASYDSYKNPTIYRAYYTLILKSIQYMLKTPVYGPRSYYTTLYITPFREWVWSQSSKHITGLFTILHLCCYYGLYEVVEALNPGIQAVDRSHLSEKDSIVEINDEEYDGLLKQKVNDRYTALYFALKSNYPYRMVKALLVNISYDTAEELIDTPLFIDVEQSNFNGPAISLRMLIKSMSLTHGNMLMRIEYNRILEKLPSEEELSS